MQPKNTIVLLAVIVLIAVIAYSTYFRASNIPLPSNVLFKNCVIDSSTGFDLCYHNDTLNDDISYGALPKLISGVTVNYRILSGVKTKYLLNLSSLGIQGEYELCTNSVSLSGKNNLLGADLVQYDPATKMVFSCVLVSNNSSGMIISDSGIMPCFSDLAPLIQIYVFPADFTGSVVDDFKNGISISRNVFNIYGETIC